MLSGGALYRTTPCGGPALIVELFPLTHHQQAPNPTTPTQLRVHPKRADTTP